MVNKMCLRAMFINVRCYNDLSKMDQQSVLRQYIDRSHQIYNSLSSIIVYNEQPNFYSTINFFDKKLFENQPQLDSYPLSRQKEEEPTQENEANVPKQSEKLNNLSKQLHFSSQRIETYKKCLQGSRNDTMELNINFKTLLVSHFRQLSHLQELNLYQQSIVQKFAQQSPSFHSLKDFYEQRAGKEGIRQKCFDFLSSKRCIKRILIGRCKLRNKIMMIKFIETMRRNLSNGEQITKWKDNPKLQQSRSR